MPFPDGFIWGTVASSTQTEGAAPESDWRRWEDLGRAPDSRDGNGFATRYAEDFRLLADHWLPHHRLSVEWARIEPRQGQHDGAAIEHYRRVLDAARDAGIRIWLCLHHFSLPGWFTETGGFLDDRSRGYFWPRHVDFVAQTLGDLVHGWTPIHEPGIWASAAFRWGTLPPGKHDDDDWVKALRGIHYAHRDAWRQLRGGGRPVSTAHALAPVHAAEADAEARRHARLVDEVVWDVPRRAHREGILAIPGRAEEEVPDLEGSADLFGFTYNDAVGITAAGTAVPWPRHAAVGPLGTAPWPEGLGQVLHRLSGEIDTPLLIAGCGIGTVDDDRRADYLRASIDQTETALAEGSDVRGFFIRSAIDGYEWGYGFDVPFGLFDRDRNPRSSLEAIAPSLPG